MPLNAAGALLQKPLENYKTHFIVAPHYPTPI